MRQATLILLVGLALGATGVVGCGESDEQQAEDAALAYWEAYSNDDGAGMCAQMSENFEDTASSGGVVEVTCEETAAELARRDVLQFPEVTNSSVSGDTAQVEITGSGGVTYVTDLVKEDDEWKVNDAERAG